LGRKINRLGPKYTACMTELKKKLKTKHNESNKSMD
jgi:hypothetical protein